MKCCSLFLSYCNHLDSLELTSVSLGCYTMVLGSPGSYSIIDYASFLDMPSGMAGIGSPPCWWWPCASYKWALTLSAKKGVTLYYTGWGKSRFTVWVCKTEFILILPFIHLYYKSITRETVNLLLPNPVCLCYLMGKMRIITKLWWGLKWPDLIQRLSHFSSTVIWVA